MSNNSQSGSSGGPAAGLAARYAQALYAFAAEQDVLEEVATQATVLEQTISGSTELQNLLHNPLVKGEALTSLFDTLSQKHGLHDALRRFIGVVMANHRGAAFFGILRAFQILVRQRAGIVDVAVGSATPLTDAQKEQLNDKLAGLGYDRAKLSIVYDVDRALLGGLVVRIGAYQYDTSLKSRLQRLQLAMKEAA